MAKKKRTWRPSSGRARSINVGILDTVDVREFREECGLEPVNRYAGNVTCLRCEREFESSDRRNNRVCASCKGTQAWREGSRGDDLYLRSSSTHDIPDLSRTTSGDGGQAHRDRLKKRGIIRNKKEDA